MSEIRPKARNSGIVVQEFENEILIYDLIANRAFNLNETSTIVWHLSDGNKTVSEIAVEMTRRFNSPITQDFIWLALKQLNNENMLETAPQMPEFFQNSSRREIIRKIGLATLVALPVISTLLVPTSASAASLNCATTPFPNNCPCTAAAQCQSNCCGSLGGTFACTAPGLDPAGSPCRANCECAPGLTCPAVTPRVCA